MEEVSAEQGAREAVIASAIMSRELPASDLQAGLLGGNEHCVVGRFVQISSRADEGLWLHAHNYPVSGCEGVRLPSAERSYRVEKVTYVDGRKSYRAKSDLGEAWLFDNRASGYVGFTSWSLLQRDFDTPLPLNHNPWESLFANRVDDRNLNTSGKTARAFLLSLTEPMSPTEVEKLCCSLKLDRTRTAPLDPNHPLEYRLAVIGDLPPEHVLTQLRGLELVRAAEFVGSIPPPPPGH
jgi:hypothetical protein